jgi:hypothetical protein
MTEGGGNGGANGPASKEELTMVATFAIVAILVAAVLFVGMGRSTERLVTGGADNTILLGPRDMGWGWTLTSNYTINFPAPGADNVMEGLYTYGGVGMYKDDANGNMVYMMNIELGIFNTVENATAGYANISGILLQYNLSPGTTYKNVTVGDDGLLLSAKHYHPWDNNASKVLLFQERNVICIIIYSPATADVTVTEQDMINVANKQLSKL